MPIPRKSLGARSDMKRWIHGVGIAWIAGSALYLYVHFMWVFYDGNRDAIAAVLSGLLP